MANSRNYKLLNGKYNVIGEAIYKYRTSLKLSRQMLSDKLIILGIDIPAASIYDIEKGNRSIVDYEICGIAKILKISPGDLLNNYYNSLD